jgi:hypothetical protein
VRLAVHGGLPGGRVLVCRDASAGAPGWDCDDDARSPVVVRVGWRLPDAVGASLPQVSLVAGGEP